MRVVTINSEFSLNGLMTGLSKLISTFSTKTMIAIGSNDKLQISNAVKYEIVIANVTLAMVHTIKPTPQEYTILAERIVAKFPVLAVS